MVSKEDKAKEKKQRKEDAKTKRLERAEKGSRLKSLVDYERFMKGPHVRQDEEGADPSKEEHSTWTEFRKAIARDT